MSGIIYGSILCKQLVKGWRHMANQRRITTIFVTIVLTLVFIYSIWNVQALAGETEFTLLVRGDEEDDRTSIGC